jgi:hypothetical protein
VQRGDAGRKVRSEYQDFGIGSSRAYYNRNREKILQKRREKRFMNFCGPERAMV